MKIIANPFLRRLVFALGVCSLFVGFVGLFVPILPTAPFLILTAWCFLRSSPKAHSWLYSQPYLSKVLTDWDELRSIATKSKALAIGMICCSMFFVWLTIPLLAVKLSLTFVLVAVSVFILTRPKPP